MIGIVILAISLLLLFYYRIMSNCKENKFWKRYYLMYRFNGKLQRRWFYFKHSENKFYNSIIKDNESIKLRKRMQRY